MSAQIIRENPPDESRVMFESYPDVVVKVLAAPNVWHLVAAGGTERRRVYSQTAYQIRRGKIAAFALREDGVFEVRVVTEGAPPAAGQVDDATTKMYLRWVPNTKV